MTAWYFFGQLMTRPSASSFNFKIKISLISKHRHFREYGKPLPDARRAMFYQRLSCFDSDSRLLGNDGVMLLSSQIPPKQTAA